MLRLLLFLFYKIECLSAFLCPESSLFLAPDTCFWTTSSQDDAYNGNELCRKDGGSLVDNIGIKKLFSVEVKVNQYMAKNNIHEVWTGYNMAADETLENITSMCTDAPVPNTSNECFVLTSDSCFNRTCCQEEHISLCWTVLDICPNGSLYNVNKSLCYWITNKKNTADESEETCRKNNGTLAVFQNTYEYEFLVDNYRLIIVKESQYRSWVFIGGKDLNGTDTVHEFAKTDGNVLEFTKWFPDEPNDKKEQEDCIAISARDQFKWHDLNCRREFPALCYKTTGECSMISESAQSKFCPQTVSLIYNALLKRISEDFCPCCLLNINKSLCYWLTNGSYTADKNENICKEGNGSPSTFETEEEYHFLVQNYGPNITYAGLTDWAYVWIGGKDINTTNEFMKPDGTQLNYTKWAQGQPNHFIDLNEDCIAMYTSNYYQWNDFDCNNKLHALCYRINVNKYFAYCQREETILKFNQSLYGVWKNEQTFDVGEKMYFNSVSIYGNSTDADVISVTVSLKKECDGQRVSCELVPNLTTVCWPNDEIYQYVNVNVTGSQNSTPIIKDIIVQGHRCEIRDFHDSCENVSMEIIWSDEDNQVTSKDGCNNQGNIPTSTSDSERSHVTTLSNSHTGSASKNQFQDYSLITESTGYSINRGSTTTKQQDYISETTKTAGYSTDKIPVTTNQLADPSVTTNSAESSKDGLSTDTGHFGYSLPSSTPESSSDTSATSINPSGGSERSHVTALPNSHTGSVSKIQFQDYLLITESTGYSINRGSTTTKQQDYISEVTNTAGYSTDKIPVTTNQLADPSVTTNSAESSIDGLSTDTGHFGYSLHSSTPDSSSDTSATSINPSGGSPHSGSIVTSSIDGIITRASDNPLQALSNTVPLETTTSIYNVEFPTSEIPTVAPEDSTARLQPSTLEESECMCKCADLKSSSITNEELQSSIDEMVKELTIDKTKTNAARRKLISATDNRPAAQAVGCIGIVILCIVGGLVVLGDVPRLIRFIRHIREEHM